MKKVCVIGNLGSSKESFDGQTIKTRIVIDEIQKRFGKENVKVINSNGGIKKVFLLILRIILTAFFYKNIVIMPAQNGLRVIPPLISIINVLFSRQVHYVVIGGWMPSLIENKPFLKFCLKSFNHIYVETSVMQAALKKMNFKNVEVMFNCKSLKILAEHELKTKTEYPLKFCIFSRVMKQKGVEHAVYAISELNNIYGENKCCLDIYGKIDENELDWFESLKQTFAENIHYRGLVSFDKSVETVKKYDVLLFPTLFYTEGIPGTLIDAYAAGVPVISSRWESFSDVVDENVVGMGYSFGSKEALLEVMKKVVDNPELLIKMKINCISKAKVFTPSIAMANLLNNLN